MTEGDLPLSFRVALAFVAVQRGIESDGKHYFQAGS